jgi:WD40 repeat protein
VVGFHPKNEWVVAVSAQDYVREADQGKSVFFIHLLDVESLIEDGAVIQRGHMRGVIEETGRVDRLLFHPNGRYLASLLSDDAIHLWDIESGKLIAHLSCLIE